MTLQRDTAKASTLRRLASLYQGDSLPDVVDLIDQLHTAISEGDLSRFTSLPQEEVAGLLEELIFVAQETLIELSKQRQARVAGQRKVILRLMPKGQQTKVRDADAV